MAAELAGKYQNLKNEWAKAYEEMVISQDTADEWIQLIQRVRDAAKADREQQTDAVLLLCSQLEEAVRKDAVAKGQEWDMLSRRLGELLTEINTKHQHGCPTVEQEGRAKGT